MVQVDLFLTYGIGAAFALAAAPAIDPADTAPRQQPMAALTAALLCLSILFVPSGSWLLQRFPAWETMHLTSHPPAWLYAAFPAGVILAGTVGFATTHVLLRRGARWAATLQCIWSAFSVYLVLLHGWDGTGLRRLLTADPAHWPATAHQPLGALATQWVTTPVAHTLGGMLAVAVPVTFVLLRQLRLAALRSLTTGPAATAAATRFAGTLLGTMVVLCGIAAIGLNLLITAVGTDLGLAAFMVVALPMLHPRGPLARMVSRCLPSPAAALSCPPHTRAAADRTATPGHTTAEG